MFGPPAVAYAGGMASMGAIGIFFTREKALDAGFGMATNMGSYWATTSREESLSAFDGGRAYRSAEDFLGMYSLKQ
jgi:hypothetical protein